MVRALRIAEQLDLRRSHESDDDRLENFPVTNLIGRQPVRAYRARPCEALEPRRHDAVLVLANERPNNPRSCFARSHSLSLAGLTLFVMPSPGAIDRQWRALVQSCREAGRDRPAFEAMHSAPAPGALRFAMTSLPPFGVVEVVLKPP